MSLPLKTKNMPLLAAYLVGHVALFLFLVGEDPSSVLQLDLSSGLASALLLTLAAYVVSEALADNAKARLVFWRWHNPLPGCAAFSKYMHEDDRIDPVALEARYGSLPTDPVQQNRLWYKAIYKPHRDAQSVMQAHARYLLFREMVVVSAVVALVALPAAAVLAIPFGWKAGYCSVLVLQHILITLSAANLGVRFVKNALAEACA